MTRDNARNAALGKFLRSRRAKISPAQAAPVPGPTVRRVPGPRGTEIARLAGVSVDYCVRLERYTWSGHHVSVSGTVLVAIARALRLTTNGTIRSPWPGRPRTAPRPLPPQRVRPAWPCSASWRR